MPNPHFRAMLLSLLAFTLWTFCDATMKAVGLSGTSLSLIIVPISFSGAITIAAIAAWRGRARHLMPSRLKAETARAIINTLQGFAGLMVITTLPLTTFYAVIFFAPILIALLAAQFLYEKLSWRHYCAMGIGFAGVLIALNPSVIHINEGELWGYIALPVCLILCVINNLMTRLAGRSIDSCESMAFYPQLVRTVIVLPLFIWQMQPLALWQWLSVLSAGAVSGIAWMFFSMAMKDAPTAIVSPFQYSQIVTGGIIGYLAWNHIPSWHLVAGSVIIIAAGYYMMLLTNREKLSDA